jgi:hypothetical protein
MQFYLEAGLIILALAFPVSFFAGLSVTIPLAEKRVLIALRENPESYLNYVRDAFLSMILLPVAGLGFSIVGFMREIKHPTGILDKWWHLLTIFGAFFFSWGAYMLSWTLDNYSEVSQGAGTSSSLDILRPLRTVYAAVLVGDILWLLAGILFMLSPAFRLMLKRKIASTTK